MHKWRVLAVVGLVVGMTGCFTNPGVTLSNYAAGSPSSVTFTYTLSQALTTGDFLLVGVLPSAFTVANGSGQAFCSANIAITINGSARPFTTSGDTCSASANTVRIILGTASLPGGTAVAVTVSGAIVTNPPTAGTYTMTTIPPTFYTATTQGFVIEAAPADLSLVITAPAAASPAPALSSLALAALALLLCGAGCVMTRRLRISA